MSGQRTWGLEPLAGAGAGTTGASTGKSASQIGFCPFRAGRRAAHHATPPTLCEGALFLSALPCGGCGCRRHGPIPTVVQLTPSGGLCIDRWRWNAGRARNATVCHGDLTFSIRPAAPSPSLTCLGCIGRLGRWQVHSYLPRRNRLLKEVLGVTFSV